MLPMAVSTMATRRTSAVVLRTTLRHDLVLGILEYALLETPRAGEHCHEP